MHLPPPGHVRFWMTSLTAGKFERLPLSGRDGKAAPSPIAQRRRRAVDGERAMSEEGKKKCDGLSDGDASVEIDAAMEASGIGRWSGGSRAVNMDAMVMKNNFMFCVYGLWCVMETVQR